MGEVPRVTSEGGYPLKISLVVLRVGGRLTRAWQWCKISLNKWKEWLQYWHGVDKCGSAGWGSETNRYHYQQTPTSYSRLFLRFPRITHRSSPTPPASSLCLHQPQQTHSIDLVYTPVTSTAWSPLVPSQSCHGHLCSLGFLPSPLPAGNRGLLNRRFISFHGLALTSPPGDILSMRLGF